jgi:hypothetical protein
MAALLGSTERSRKLFGIAGGCLVAIACIIVFLKPVQLPSLDQIVHGTSTTLPGTATTALPATATSAVPVTATSTTATTLPLPTTTTAVPSTITTALPTTTTTVLPFIINTGP